MTHRFGRKSALIDKTLSGWASNNSGKQAQTATKNYNVERNITYGCGHSVFKIF